MSYKDVPHAAVNELVKWVHKQGKQIVSLHTWPHLVRWSPPSDWSAHINVHSTSPLHARIKRKGYKFTVVYESDDSLCPVCSASGASVMIFANAAVEALEPAVVAR